MFIVVVIIAVFAMPRHATVAFDEHVPLFSVSGESNGL